ncbi:MAG: AsmA family protein [Pseudomonadota bacterium]
MIKSVRYIAVLVIVGIVIAIGTVFAVTAGISSDTARQAIEQRMGDILGLPVRLRGRTEVHLFPSPYAVFNGVRISGAENSTTIEVGRVEADFDVLSLFRSIPTFSAFRMDAPDITLGVDDNGIVLWPSVETVAKQGSATEAPPEITDNLDLISTIRKKLPASIGRVSFQGGTIRFADRDGEITTYLTDLEGLLNWPNRDGALTLEASFSRQGADGQISISSASIADLDSVDGGDLSASLQFMGANISFAGQSALARPRYAEGQIDIQLDGALSVSSWIVDAPLLTAGVEQLRVSGPVSATENRLRMDSAEVAINSDAAVGAVEFLRREAGTASLTSTLAFDQLDLARLAGPGWRAMQRSFEPDGGLRSQMTGIDVDLRVSASAALLENGELNQFAGALTVRDDMIAVDVGDAVYEGGRVQFRYKDEYKSDSSGAYLSFRVSDLNSTSVADQLVLGPLFPRGTISMTGDFNGSSGTLRQFWRGATGKLSVSASDGVIPGVALDTIFLTDSGNQFMALEINDNAGDRFEALNGEFMLNNSAFQVADLSITYPAELVTVEGIISPINGSIALTTKLQGDDSNRQSSTVFVGGTLGRPYATQVLFPFAEPPMER